MNYGYVFLTSSREIAVKGPTKPTPSIRSCADSCFKLHNTNSARLAQCEDISEKVQCQDVVPSSLSQVSRDILNMPTWITAERCSANPQVVQDFPALLTGAGSRDTSHPT